MFHAVSMVIPINVQQWKDKKENWLQIENIQAFTNRESEIWIDAILTNFLSISFETHI